MVKVDKYVFRIGDIAVTITCHLAGHRLFVAASASLNVNSNHSDNSNTCRRCQLLG